MDDKIIVEIHRALAEAREAGAKCDCSICAQSVLDSMDGREEALIEDIMGAFPNFEKWHSGGGCMAWRHPLDNGGHILVTELNGCELPDNDAEFVMCGYYRGPEEDGSVDEVARADLTEWIENALKRGALPPLEVRPVFTVDEYFEATFGESLDDNIGGDVGIESKCGEDCCNAIEHARGFLAAMKMAGDWPRSRASVISMCREIVQVFICG